MDPLANRLLVLDAETPWILNLFQALPAGWSAEFLGPRTAGLSPRAWLSPPAGFVPVPGWTRAFRASTWLFARRVRPRSNSVRAVVHTIPWTAGLLSELGGVPHVYRPHDFFGMYDWAQARVAGLERDLMRLCRFAAPVSEAQAGDLRPVGPAPVAVVRNGVSQQFLRRFDGAAGPRPADLPPAGRPVVGCVGQITTGYDLDLIGGLADAAPEAEFVFIGPAFDAAADFHSRVKQTFARPNVRWLGAKPHAELPGYLAHFDVCFNPLKVNDWNDRRSPLRLYDYLASGKPVISTDIAAAREHSPHVAVGRDAAELAGRVRDLLARDTGGEFRRDFARRQTWEDRGREFAGLVEKYCP